MAFTFGSTPAKGFSDFPKGVFTFRIEEANLIWYGGGEHIHPCYKANLILKVDLDMNTQRTVYDNLYFDNAYDPAKSRVERAFQSIGVDLSGQTVDEKVLAAKLIGGTGKAQFRPQKENKSYGEVAYYIVPEVKVEEKKPAVVNGDDLPF